MSLATPPPLERCEGTSLVNGAVTRTLFNHFACIWHGTIYSTVKRHCNCLRNPSEDN